MYLYKADFEDREIFNQLFLSRKEKAQSHVYRAEIRIEDVLNQ